MITVTITIWNLGLQNLSVRYISDLFFALLLLGSFTVSDSKTLRNLAISEVYVLNLPQSVRKIQLCPTTELDRSDHRLFLFSSSNYFGALSRESTFYFVNQSQRGMWVTRFKYDRIKVRSTPTMWFPLSQFVSVSVIWAKLSRSTITHNKYPIYRVRQREYYRTVGDNL
jgi:hypothetical protein